MPAPEKGKIPDNFKDTYIRDHDTAVERGRAGGLKSGEARRKRRSMAQTMADLLEMPLRDGPQTELKTLEDAQSKGYGSKGANVSVNEAIVLAQVREAMRGSTSAANFIAELLGEKTQRLEISKSVDETVQEMEAYFAAKEEKDAEQE